MRTLEHVKHCNCNPGYMDADCVINTETGSMRLRAEVRDLKARLRFIRTKAKRDLPVRVLAALDLRRKNWSKPSWETL